MTVTTENIIDALKQVIELLNVSNDNEKIRLAVDILTLVIDYIGAERMILRIDRALGGAMSHVSGYVGALRGDMDARQREEVLLRTRRALDEIFDGMQRVNSMQAV